MLFPDETNLRHVAAALWENPHGISQASVIVGAGFSKNAVPKASVQKLSTTFPSWAELTDVMVDELYAHEPGDVRNRRKTGASGGVSNALRIAEEYEAARGRGQLDSLLKKAIPDLDFEPSPVHNALCELPWADILTTNYDTLLERAARKQLGRKYLTVLSQQDIPTTQQPRIIKLHGSFPESKQPFVITEEDFRTYESSFPAMVNLAQQCLAEKTCCLVGFSGDDPNFLRWSGWVRDVLGHSHMQPVYLVGLHDHSPSQKSLLDRRHVHTIDLSPLFPKDDWPNAGDRHSAAAAWFIEALKALKPPVTADWPEQSSEAFTSLAIPSPSAEFPTSNATQFQTEYAQPNSMELTDRVDDLETPKEFNELPEAEQLRIQAESLEHKNKRNQGRELDQRIDVITSVWKNNRALFPGWLAIPWSNHGELIENTSTWASVIPERAVEKSNQKKATRWLEELAWRLDCALQPWTAQMISAVECCIDFDGLGAEGNEHEVTLALELLRAFREDGKGKKFLELLDKLSGLQRMPLNGRDFIHQQTVLFHLEHWRVKEALVELRSWDTFASSAMWKARKAALLGEFRPDIALDDAVQALSSLQHTPDLNDIYTRSREATVLWLATVLTDWEQEERQDYQRRRRDIERKLFDAFNFEERLSETLQDPPRIDLDRTDQKNRRISTQVGRAYSMRRYIEKTAGLISSPGLTVYADRIQTAVPWMAISDPEEALRFSVRHRTSIDQNRTFPTHMLAALGRETISNQLSGLVNTISFLIKEPNPRVRHLSKGQDTPPGDFINEKIRNSLIRAAISHGRMLRPVLTDCQKSNFTQTILEARLIAVDLDWQTLNEIEEALHELLQELSESQLSKLAPALIDQPILGVDGFPQTPLEKRDIIVSASLKSLDQPVEDHDGRPQNLEKLFSLQRATQSFENSWTATLRLAFAARQKLMSTDQIETFLCNLESQLNEVANDLQAALDCKSFHPADLLGISIGDQGRYRSLALEIISKKPWPKFLKQDELGKTTTIRHLSSYKEPSNLAVELTVDPWMSSKFYLKPSDWSLEQVVAYLSQASIWLEAEATKLIEHEQKYGQGDPFSSRGQLTWRCERICRFCNNVVLVGHSNEREATEAASALTAKIYDLLPHFAIKYAPTLVHSGAVSAFEMAHRIRRLYAGTSSEDKFSALMAVLVWATSAKSIGIDPPPPALVTEFAVIIRTRRGPDLGWALDIARILMKQCKDLIEPAFHDDVLLGLSYLVEETKPKAPSSSILGQNATLADIRVSSLRLLAEMPNSDQRETVLSSWLVQSEDEVDWEVSKVIQEISK